MFWSNYAISGQIVVQIKSNNGLGIVILETSVYRLKKKHRNTTAHHQRKDTIIILFGNKSKTSTTLNQRPTCQHSKPLKSIVET